MNYWLMKTEPDEFGIDDLSRRPGKTEPWTGVRNYQARNFMRDMRKGDLILFYHSSCAIPGVAGIAEISREAFADPTQFIPDGDYFDPKSTLDNPRWHCVEIRFKRKFSRVIPLAAIKTQAHRLKDLVLLRPGNRLSVLPVSKTHWDIILSLG